MSSRANPECGQLVQVMHAGEWVPFLVHESAEGWESDEADHIVYVRGWLWRPEHNGGVWLGWGRRQSPSDGGIPNQETRDEPAYWRWPPEGVSG